jgi:hypothetical protein
MTSSRKLPLSSLRSPTVLLKRGYIALSYPKRLRKKVRTHSTSLLKYLKRRLFHSRWVCIRNGSPFCIFMRRANHLREINHDRLAVAATNEDIEFVEITVYESRMRKPDDKVHQSGVEITRRRHMVNLAPNSQHHELRTCNKSKASGDPQRICINEFHQYTVSGLVYGPRHRELVFMQDLPSRTRPLERAPLTSHVFATRRTFNNAHSFCAANRDMYIHDADLRLPM